MKHKPVKRKDSKALQPLLPDLTIWLCGIYLVGLPFVVSFTGFDKFRTPKNIYSVLAALLLAGVFLVTRDLRFRLRFWSWEFVFLCALAYTAANVLLSKRIDVSWPAFASLLYFSVLVLIFSQVMHQAGQKKLWLAIGASSSVNAVLSVLQYLGRFPLMIRSSGETLEGRITPAGFIGEVNSGGFLFALVSLVLIYFVMAERALHLRIAGGVFLILNFVGLVFTRTLTAIIGFALCLVVWWVFHHWWILRQKNYKALVGPWIFVSVGLLVGSVAFFRSGIQERVEQVMKQMAAGDWSAVTTGRQPVYLITWDMIKAAPWLGHGLQTFGNDFFYHRAGTPVGQSVTLIPQPGAFREVHNEYLQIWEELGAIGLLFFLLLLFWPVFRSARLIVKSEPQAAYWAAILSIGALFVAVSCLGFFPLHLSVTSAYIVLVVSGLQNMQGPELAHSKPAGSVNWVKVFIASAVAVWLAYPQINKWKANNETGVAAYLLENVTQRNYSPQQKWVIVDTALKRLERAEQLYPRIYEIYSLKGSAHMLLGNAKEAEKYYKKSVGHLPAPETYTNLAASYIAQEKNKEALSSVELALKYNPEYPNARRALEFLKAKTP
ncbi:MAG: O-antigen ligase family protein [Acidobacteria bacterium]|nr:O-antigen ligase family protein [Acidobacteriota bacterium]